MKTLFKQAAKAVILKAGAFLYCIFKLFHRLLSEFAFRYGLKDYLVGPVIIKSFNYKQIEIKAQIESYWNYWRIKEYEKYPVEKVEEYINSHKDSAGEIVYYEIGANVGYSLLVIGKMLKAKGEAFAFEIEPTNFKTLSNNILINQLNNTTAIPIGIAENFSIQKFYFNRYHDQASKLPSSGMGMHSVKFDSQVHNRDSFYKALLMPLDAIIKLFSIPLPTHLFIDAYGAEDTIVSGMKDTLMNDKLKMVMADIETKLEESKAHKDILNSGFKMIDCFSEKKEDVVPANYKCTYSRQG